MIPYKIALSWRPGQSCMATGDVTTSNGWAEVAAVCINIARPVSISHSPV